MRFLSAGVLAALIVVGVAHCAKASEKVDAIIVTGLDVSSSVDADEVEAQVAYMVAAMQDPVVQSRITHGYRGKIGFAVYLWSSGCASIIDWRTVGSPEDLDAVLLELQKAKSKEAINLAQADGDYHPALTDTSRAMTCGLEAIRNAPYGSYRKVLNIVTNGVDNVGGPDIGVVANAQNDGVTVNAMITPGGTDEPADLKKFLETFVKTGPTSFVLEVKSGDDMINAWIKKFIGDMS